MAEGGWETSTSCPRCDGHLKEAVGWHMVSETELRMSYEAWCGDCDFTVNYENEAWFPAPDKDFKEVTVTKLIPLFLPGDIVECCDRLAPPRKGVVVKTNNKINNFCPPGHVGVMFFDSLDMWEPINPKYLERSTA